MTARVLVVDDILANVKLLEARLTAEYFDVITAMSGPDAIEICKRGECDIVLLDVMMPGMDGFETARQIKSDPETQHLPIIMVTALDQPSDKVKGLQAGADDFLTKPVNDLALITRVRSLARLKTLTDELRMRAATTKDMGLVDVNVPPVGNQTSDGRVLLIEDRASSQERISRTLGDRHSVSIESNPHEAVFRASDGDFELFIVSLNFTDFDGLRLCSQIRSLERIRNTPILIVTEPEDNARLLRGLELGVNDYIVRPIDPNELHARVSTQLRRKRYAEHLRTNVQNSMEMAITDPLTGLHNRRYMEGHLRTLVEEAVARDKPLSLLIADIDFFKAVNDTHGHDAGDEVLKEFSNRMRINIRGVDLACRLGGEEFVVVMPETDRGVALQVAERMRQCMAQQEFPIHNGTNSVAVTVSVGVATIEHENDTPDSLLKRADQALYAAKRDGRNRVVADAA